MEREKLSTGYLASILLLMGIFPLLSFAMDRFASGDGQPAWTSAFRWFLFWGVGVRLLTAGFRQIVQPSFTAREIFRLDSAEVEVVVRELGFSNVCMGLGAMIAGFVPAFRPCAAFIGGLYFGVAGAMHVLKKPATPNEWVALASDLFIFAMMTIGLVFTVL